MIRVLSAVALLLCASVSAVKAKPFACERPAILVKGASLVGRHGRFDMAVVDGRIIAIGGSGRVRLPSGARVIDARGATLLPGLIDSHVHLRDIGPALSPELSRPSREKALPVTLRATLRSGVTAARVHLSDLKDGPWSKRQSEDPCFPGPRLVVGGPGLTFDAPDADYPTFRGFHDPTEARRRVDEAAAAGVDWIAFHDVEKGSPELVQSLMAHARAQGLKVMMAADRPASLALALTLKPDSIDYLQTEDPAAYAGVPHSGDLDSGDLVFGPTLGRHLREADVAENHALLDDPSAYEFMSLALAAAVREAAHAQADRYDAAELRRSAEAAERSFRLLLASGRRLVLATDSGSTPYWQHEAIWWEFAAWRHAGATLPQIVEAASRTPAALLGLKNLGRLAPGAQADFVLYDGDLSEGLLSTARVRTVVKAGVIFVDAGAWVGP